MTSYDYRGSLGDIEGDPLDDYHRGNERRHRYQSQKLAYLKWLVAQPMCSCGVRHLAKGPKCYECLCTEMLPIQAHNLSTYGRMK